MSRGRLPATPTVRILNATAREIDVTYEAPTRSILAVVAGASAALLPFLAPGAAAGTAAVAASPAVDAAAPAADLDGASARAVLVQDTTPGELTSGMLSEFEYRFIGPANPSGRVTALAVPEEPRRRVMYTGLASGGIWKTDDGGATWNSVFDQEGTSSIGDLAVAPWDHDVVWAGTGERNSLRSNSWGNGLHRSDDGGETWTHVGLEETREIGRIAVHPTDTGTVYVGALGHLWGPNPERGVYRTTDRGESWEKVLFVNDTTGIVDLKMNPRDPDVLYAAAWHRLRWGGGHMEGAGAGSGIYRTTDGGETWTELTRPGLDNGLPTEKLGRIGLAVHPEDPEIVYAVIQAAHGARRPDVSPHGGIFRSDDGGDSWERVHDVSAVPDYFYNEVWLNPTDPDELFLAQTRLHRSTDGGRSVEVFDVGRVHVDHHAMWIDPEHPDHMVLGNDGGVYVSEDHGETWDHQIIPASQFYEVDVDSTRAPYHVCGGTQDNGTWCGPSRTRERVGITEADWYKVFGGDGFVSAVSVDSPNVRYAEYQYGNLTRTDVARWEHTPLQPLAEDAGAESGYAFRWDWNTPFRLSHHDQSTIYLGGNHLFRLTDRGEDWEILGPDMTRGNRHDPEPEVDWTSYRSLHSVAESTLDASVLWAGSNGGLLWVSTDRGESWRNVTGNLPDGGPIPRCWVSEIEPSPHDAATVFVTFDCHRRDDYAPHVYRTRDHGRTWTDITGDLPGDVSSFAIRQSPENPDVLFLGTARGVFYTADGGDRWVHLESNLPHVEVRDLDFAPRSQRKELVVSTFGRSIWILSTGALEGVTPDVLASDAHLFEVQPARQFNLRDTYGEVGDRFFQAGAVRPEAHVTYWLGADLDGEVTLEIREPGEDGEEGDVIRRLSGPGSAGFHQITWDLERAEPRARRLGDPVSAGERRRVPPGTYTVTLTAGDVEQTEEIVVRDGWPGPADGTIR